MDVPNNQENPELGTRKVPFGRELYIEREDFKIDPPRKYFRLFPGNEVTSDECLFCDLYRLRNR